MIKVLTASLLTLAVSSTMILPAFADEPVAIADSASDSAKTADSTSSEKKKDTAASSAKKGSDTGLGTRLCSFVTGCTVGIPVAMVRRTGIEIVQGSKDLLGDHNDWYFFIPAGVITVPFGTASGVFGGTLYGMKNAWVGSGDEPFGKESFSLGEMN